MFREPQGGKLSETDFLAATPTNDDEVKMDIPKVSGAKDNSEPLSSVHPPISVVATKLLSSNMDSRYDLPTKTPYFS